MGAPPSLESDPNRPAFLPPPRGSCWVSRVGPLSGAHGKGSRAGRRCMSSCHRSQKKATVDGGHSGLPAASTALASNNRPQMDSLQGTFPGAASQIPPPHNSVAFSADISSPDVSPRWLLLPPPCQRPSRDAFRGGMRGFSWWGCSERRGSAWGAAAARPLQPTSILLRVALAGKVPAIVGGCPVGLAGKRLRTECPPPTPRGFRSLSWGSR